MDFQNICCDIYMLEAASKLLELACVGTDEEPTHEWVQIDLFVLPSEQEEKPLA